MGLIKIDAILADLLPVFVDLGLPVGGDLALPVLCSADDIFTPLVGAGLPG